MSAAPPPLRVGIVGYGLMGKAHSYGYRVAPLLRRLPVTPVVNELWYGGADDDIRLYGMRRIRAEHPSHSYAAQWWPIGQGVGYGSSFANQAADLLAGWPDAPWSPGFRDGAAVQAVCDAMQTSAASGRWVSVSEVIADTR